ncbi:protein kinase domain-containing protein [Halostreptopolyspora alba]|uniref:protein kinase domain-containing protein n=1 Tax=Halostreptopolyspora alba TaxID=2487137 RepID=UPI00268471AA
MSSELFVGPDSEPDKYRLVRSVGRGGEATLYLAEVHLAGQTEPVVVKVLDSDFAGGEEQFAELSRRWNEQAELLRFINRLGVVGVREHFEGAPEHRQGESGEYTDRCLYLVMNHVTGLDLRDWRAEHAVEGPKGQREVLRYLEQVAEVLDLLHSGKATPSKRVVVHGDLSPGNIMISEEGQATLVDFGLSKIATRHLTAKPWFTPGYAAPEVFNGEYSAATDRYAFGAIVYFALAGEEPPPAPEQLRERFAALPIMRVAGEQQRDKVLVMFSAEPEERPEALDWVRTLRSLSTSVPWSGPVSNPATSATGGAPAGAVGGAAAGAAMAGSGQTAPEGGGGAKGPGSGTGPAPPSGGGGTPPGQPGPAGHPGSGGPAAPPPSGPRFSGPTPVTGAHPTQPSGLGDSRRPVGGMRGTPTPPTPPGGPPPQAGTPAGPPGGGQPPRGAAAAAGAPEPEAGQTTKKSKKPLLAGLAALAAVFMVAGAGLTYVAMDRLAVFADDADASAGGEPSAPGNEAAGEETPSEPERPEPDDDASAAASPEERPDEMSLTSEEPVEESDFESTLATVNAVDYDDALTVVVSCGDEGAEYNLERDYSELTTTVGLDDDSSSGHEVTFTVLGDGEQLETKTLVLGEDAELTVDVTDVLRLQLLVDGESCGGNSTAVWGDPVVTR